MKKELEMMIGLLTLTLKYVSSRGSVLLAEGSCSESQIIKVFIQEQQECIYLGKYELEEI